MNPIRLSLVGTVVFVLAGLHATIDPERPHVFVALSLLEFAAGTLVFLFAFWRAIGRSRTEAIGIGGLFFAAGTAPARVQRLLVGSFALQTVAAVVFASIRLYTPLAFGVLAPMWSLGLMGLWVALHGTFPAREPEPTRAARRAESQAAHRRAAAPRAERDEE